MNVQEIYEGLKEDESVELGFARFPKNPKITVRKFWKRRILLEKVITISYRDFLNLPSLMFGKNFRIALLHVREAARDLENPNTEKPWDGPSDRGEMPKDMCCQKAAGKRCRWHDPNSYEYKEGKWVMK